MNIRRPFDRYYPSLVRFLYRRLGDRDQAEDLAQEAFIRLMDHRPRRVRAWLFAVALNLVRDAHRADTRFARRLQLARGEADLAIDARAEADVLRSEVVRRVRTALASLSERDRTLLLLREEGLSYREIAEVIGVSPASVGPLLGRAQRRFIRNWSGSGKKEGKDAQSSL